MNSRLLLVLTLPFLLSGFVFSQTTLIEGKFSCFNESECCIQCPWISLISKDTINTNPDINGNFKKVINKNSGTFSIKIQSIGLLTIEIIDIPFLDTVFFESVYLYNCAKITPSKYKRISKQLKKEYKNQSDYSRFMTDNFVEIFTIGGERFYFDYSNSYPDSVINPINNKKRIKIQPDNRQVIRLRYSDLIN